MPDDIPDEDLESQLEEVNQFGMEVLNDLFSTIRDDRMRMTVIQFLVANVVLHISQTGRVKPRSLLNVLFHRTEAMLDEAEGVMRGMLQ